MKISFSTVGCPNSSWTDIYTMAKDLAFDGIEIRGLGDDIFAVNARPFTAEALPSTIKKLNELKLSIACLSSGASLKNKDKYDAVIYEITSYVALAEKLNAPYIRILADSDPMPLGDGIDDEYIIGVLKTLAERFAKSSVTLLVETNGVYADTARLKAVLDAVGSERIAALWDMHHPYRYFDEDPEQTINNLGEYIKHVHIKDSVIESGRASYKMMGEGDLPIDAMLKALKRIGYRGYVSLEWVKRWSAGLSDAGIVFPHFASFMQPYIVKSAALQSNKRGTGYYIWKKEHLIGSTFPDVLDRVCEEFPDQYAFRYTELDYTRTYPEFREDVNRFARALIALGVKAGDHVAIWATNVPEWYITFWAATKIGAVLVTVNTAYKVYEAEYLLKQSDTHTLVMIDGYRDSDYVGIMRTLCPELAASAKGGLNSKRLPVLKNVITVGCTLEGAYTFEEAMDIAERVPYQEVEARRSRIKAHDVCNMQYTSGTTGFPKGVMLTHYNVVNNGKNIGDNMDFSTADKLMIHVPMFHCFGLVLAMTAAVTHGTTMCPMPVFSPKKSLQCINQEKVTACHGVPTMFIAMLSHEDFDKTDFSHMRTGIMAGSPCPVKVMQDVVDKMKMNEVCIVFGQTEASPGCTMSSTTDPIEARINTVGKAMYGVECKIVDPATNEELPSDTDGEFVVRGYNIMKGYYKMPEATAAAIDADGWLHTGDLSRCTSEGYYKITGRIKDMIIRGGENIYPKEIEDFLYTHPKVKDVQVIGVPDQRYGEEIMACIIPNEGDILTEDEVKEYVKANMAKHKVPRYVSFVTEFPMNAAGKILKYKMREAAVEALNLQAANKIETA